MNTIIAQTKINTNGVEEKEQAFFDAFYNQNIGECRRITTELYHAGYWEKAKELDFVLDSGATVEDDDHCGYDDVVDDVMDNHYQIV